MYLLLFDTILAALFWMHFFTKIELGETYEKRITIIELTTNKSIGQKDRCIISKKLPNMSEVMELEKTTY